MVQVVIEAFSASLTYTMPKFRKLLLLLKNYLLSSYLLITSMDSARANMVVIEDDIGSPLHRTMPESSKNVLERLRALQKRIEKLEHQVYIITDNKLATEICRHCKGDNLSFSSHQSAHSDYSIGRCDEFIRRAQNAVIRQRCYSAVWKWVPPNYYDTPLEQRARILKATSIHQLCKSMLMENRAFEASLVNGGSTSETRTRTSTTTPRNGNYCSSEIILSKTTAADWTYSQYYLVMVQYSAAISTKKLELAMRQLRPINERRLDPSKFDFRVAKEVR